MDLLAEGCPGGRHRASRLNRIRLDNFGDCKAVGEGVEELRIDVGTGYRVYFGRQGALVVILLCGGSKKTQAKDIGNAKELLEGVPRCPEPEQKLNRIAKIFSSPYETQMKRPTISALALRTETHGCF